MDVKAEAKSEVKEEVKGVKNEMKTEVKPELNNMKIEVKIEQNDELQPRQCGDLVEVLKFFASLDDVPVSVGWMGEITDVTSEGHVVIKFGDTYASVHRKDVDNMKIWKKAFVQLVSCISL